MWEDTSHTASLAQSEMAPATRGSDLGNTLVRDIIARATLVLIMGFPTRGIAAPLLFASNRVDEITFAAPTGDRFGTEILITKRAVSGRNHYFYQALIGYVTNRNRINELSSPHHVPEWRMQLTAGRGESAAPRAKGVAQGWAVSQTQPPRANAQP